MEWLDIARGLIGTTEAPGKANNNTIINWANRLGAKILGVAYREDSTPWCGVFVAHCMNAAGIAPPAIAIRAKSWADWGANIAPERIAPGAVLVFQREGGGHVGFYLGEDSKTYLVLGGNQGDKVSITRIAKDRCIARRWPKGVAVTGGPVWQRDGNGPVSRNEA